MPLSWIPMLIAVLVVLVAPHPVVTTIALIGGFYAAVVFVAGLVVPPRPPRKP